MTAAQRPELAIVMPAYNEEGCIEAVVRNWIRILERIPGVMIVVDDGSRDRTGAILESMRESLPALRVLRQPNGGHGSAVRAGYLAALESGASYVFQVDSDDQFLVEDFSKLWERKEESPFLLGRRVARDDPFHRRLITRLARLVVFLGFGRWIRDGNIPFRLMRSDVLRALLGKIPAGVFAPNLFLSLAAARAGYALGEIPVSHRERATGQVSIVRWGLIRACFRSVGELVRFRIAGGGSNP